MYDLSQRETQKKRKGKGDLFQVYITQEVNRGGPRTDQSLCRFKKKNANPAQPTTGKGKQLPKASAFSWHEWGVNGRKRIFGFHMLKERKKEAKGGGEILLTRKCWLSNLLKGRLHAR